MDGAELLRLEKLRLTDVPSPTEEDEDEDDAA